MNHRCAHGIWWRWSVLCLVVMGAPVLLCASSVTCLGDVCDLGTLGGAGGSDALFINDLGDVAGTSNDASGVQHAFLYLSGAITLTDLDPGDALSSAPEGLNSYGDVSGTISGPSPEAFLYENSTTHLSNLSDISVYGFGLNDSRTVVGSSLTSGEFQAFSWNGGTVTSLGTLGGTSSTAAFIDNNGDIAGYSYANANLSYAFYLQNGATLGLDSGNCVTAHTCAEITIGGNSTPNAMNQTTGQVVGEGYLTGTTGVEQAFLYTPGPSEGVTGGTTVNLGTLDYSGGEYLGNSDALAINDLGEVVGNSQTATGSHAFLYTGGVMTDLGTLDSGLGNSSADAINSSGWIVGTSSIAGGGTDPFLYKDGQMIDLNSPSLLAGSGFASLLTATGINYDGEIIGQGITTSGATDAYILNYAETSPPVPEPSTIISTALGALLCAAAVRMKRRHESPAGPRG